MDFNGLWRIGNISKGTQCAEKICNARYYFLHVDRFVSKDIIVPNIYLASSTQVIRWDSLAFNSANHCIRMSIFLCLTIISFIISSRQLQILARRLNAIIVMNSYKATFTLNRKRM